MDIPEYNKRIDGVVKDIQSGAHAVVMVNMALDALAMIKKRVQNEGVNAEGQKYKPYSTKPMLINCTNLTSSACSSLTGSKTKRKELDWITINGHKVFVLKGGYKQFREIQTRQTDHFDMTFSGDTWKDINLISKQAEHEKGVAVIGARNEQYKKILAGNTKRRGDILDLSAKEIETLKVNYNLGVLQIFKNNGL